MVERILERLKALWGKITEWWGKFTSKQKTLVIAMGAGVIVALVIVYAILTSPNYTLLEQCDSTKEASQITEFLDASEIKWQASTDGLQIKVPQKDLTRARLSLAGNGITTSTYSIEDALSGSLTTTEADKQKKYKLYMESTLEEDFLHYFNNIKSAEVKLFLPENDGTLLSKDEEPGAAIALDVDETFTTENAAFLAKAIATTLGCTNTDNIVIMDREANILFSGEDDASAAGNASSQLGVKQDAENILNNGVKKVLQGTGVFGDIKVTSNLVIDFSSSEETTHTYTPVDGQSQGLLSEKKSYTSESSGGTSGTPGTDSNTETTYYYRDNDYSNSTIEELYEKYLPNEYIKYTEIPAGRVLYDKSSLAVSSTNYVIVKEDDVKAQGLLDGITWDEYKKANEGRTLVEITDEMLSLASDASGIPIDEITIVAYDENFFVDSEGLGIDVNDAVQIALIVIILALLAVVVIKSMSANKQVEQPEEISVESLLQSNPEPSLDDIEAEAVSEQRKLVEKFVDENPEAVANLLRNWLNEGWE